MALAPFNVLAGGKFRTDEEEKRRLETGELGRRISRDWLRNDKEKAASRVLEKIANEIGAKSITSGQLLVLETSTLIYAIQYIS